VERKVQVRQNVVDENSHLYVFKQNLNFTFLAVVVFSAVFPLVNIQLGFYFLYALVAYVIAYLGFAVYFHFHKSSKTAAKIKSYLFKAGKEVRDLKGDIRKTADQKNVIKTLYMEKSPWTQHAVIVGASGSGKTVFVNAIQKQLLNSGAGFLFLDGKGSNSMLKQVYGLALTHGREKDFMLVNFGEKETTDDHNVNVLGQTGPKKLIRHTHKYNPMAILDKESMQDILGDMIDTTGENAEWAEKAVILGNAIGESLIVLRDLDLLVRPEDTIEIYTLEQLQASDKKIVLTFSVFKEYLSSLHNNIALTVMIDRLNVNAEFRKMVYESFQIRDLKERMQDALRSMSRIDYTKQLRDQLLFIDDWGEFIAISNKELSKKHDAEYTHDVAKDYWNKVFSIFASYVDVIDTPFSEIDFKDVVMNQKILYITLPGLKNKVTTSILAKIIVNSIKSVAVQKWKEYQITHPFTCFLDEANVWGEDEDDLIVQIGQMYRQTREAGITLVVIHQDSLGEKQGAIYGSANNVFALRVLDKDLAEHLEAFFGELEIADFSVTDQGYNSNDKTKDTQRKEAKVEKEPLAKKGDFSTLDSGEGFCAIKGVGRMKFITEYNMPVMFEPKNKRITNIPLPELMPKKKFLDEFTSLLIPEESEADHKEEFENTQHEEQSDDMMGDDDFDFDSLLDDEPSEESLEDMIEKDIPPVQKEIADGMKPRFADDDFIPKFKRDPLPTPDDYLEDIGTSGEGLGASDIEKERKEGEEGSGLRVKEEEELENNEDEEDMDLNLYNTVEQNIEHIEQIPPEVPLNSDIDTSQTDEKPQN
jgi:intracellular multiplication protein IcmO